MSYVGLRMVADINVGDVNHYISLGGLVNRNTYVGVDECGNFPSPVPLDKLFGSLRSPEGHPTYRRMTCNPGGVGHCIPFGEVLTPAGFVDIKGMKVGDPVYTVTPSGEMVEARVSQAHAEWYEGPLARVSARGMTMSCTPNHKVAKVGGNGLNPDGSRINRKDHVAPKFSLVQFKDLPGQATILRSIEWRGTPIETFTIPEAPSLSRKHSTRLGQPLTLSGVNYAALMGWFLSEGYVHPRLESFGISQMKPHGRAAIETLLKDCGFSFRWYPATATVTSRAWATYLSRFGKCRDKWVPQEIKNASILELSAFLFAAMDGDGHWEERGKSGTYYTISSRLADDMAEIALKLGYVVYQSSRQRKNRDGLSYAVNFKTVKSGGTELLTGNHVYKVATNTSRRSDVRMEQFAGPVYCIGVEGTHTFVVRQHGSIWVSGNSWVYDRYVKYGPYVWRKWRPQPELAPHITVDSIFIPARLEDNPALLKADPYYEQSLAMMGDPALYKMMRFGDWHQQAGTYFSLFDKEKHCKPCPEIKPWWPRYIGGDWGFSSWSTFYWGAWDGERLWVYRELSRQRLDPKALAKEVLLANGSDKISRFFFSPDAAGLRNSERSIVDEMNDVFSEFNTLAGETLLPKIEAAADDRVAGWQIIYQGFRTETLLISPNCVRLIDTIPTLIRNPKKPEDILKCPTDHWADGLRYLVFSRMQTDAEEPKDIRIKNFIAEATDPNVAAMRARLAEADGRFMAPVRFSGRRFV